MESFLPRSVIRQHCLLLISILLCTEGPSQFKKEIRRERERKGKKRVIAKRERG